MKQPPFSIPRPKRIFWAGLAHLGLALPLGAASPPTAPAKPNPLLMAPFNVSEVPIDNFGVSLEGVTDPGTKKITRLFITVVMEGSEADREGIKPGDEIVSINGKKVTDLNSGMEKGSELFTLFINRPPGEKIALGIVTRVSRSVTLHAVRLLGSDH